MKFKDLLHKLSSFVCLPIRKKYIEVDPCRLAFSLEDLADEYFKNHPEEYTYVDEEDEDNKSVILGAINHLTHKKTCPNYSHNKTLTANERTKLFRVYNSYKPRVNRYYIIPTIGFCKILEIIPGSEYTDCITITETGRVTYASQPLFKRSASSYFYYVIDRSIEITEDSFNRVFTKAKEGKFNEVTRSDIVYKTKF